MKWTKSETIIVALITVVGGIIAAIINTCQPEVKIINTPAPENEKNIIQRTQKDTVVNYTPPRTDTFRVFEKKENNQTTPPIKSKSTQKAKLKILIEEGEAFPKNVRLINTERLGKWESDCMRELGIRKSQSLTRYNALKTRFRGNLETKVMIDTLLHYLRIEQ